MSGKIWLYKKPQTNRDWLLIIGACILFYMVLSGLNSVLGAVGQILGILSPFAGGIVLAYILDPFVRWMYGSVLGSKPGLRWIAILCSYLVFLLLVFVLVWLVAPQVGASIATLFTSLPGYIENMQKALLSFQESYRVDLQPVVDALDDYEQLMTNAYSMLMDSAPEIVATLQTAASNVVSVFTAVASSIYMLSGKEKLLRQLRTVVHAVLPESMAENTLRICHTANENISGFFVGKVIDAVIVGLILFVTMSVLGISFTPLIAVLMTVCNIIPVFGPIIGAVPSGIILLFANPLHALEFLILVIVVQQVDSNVLAPKILSRSLGISSFWVLFAVLLGANLFGVVGMVLGVPVFATLYGLMEEAVQWALDRRGIDAEGVRIARPESAADAAVHIREDEEGPADPADSGAEAPQPADAGPQPTRTPHRPASGRRRSRSQPKKRG